MIDNKQRFYNDMEVLVNPDTYCGVRSDCCLIGQMTQKLALWDSEALAEAYNINVGLVDAIYFHVTEDKYKNNLEAALEYVRNLMGVVETVGEQDA